MLNFTITLTNSLLKFGWQFWPSVYFYSLASIDRKEKDPKHFRNRYAAFVFTCIFFQEIE